MNRDKIKALLKNYTYSDYKSLHDKYRAWLVSQKVEPSTSFPSRFGEIAVFQFRCNDEISFNDEQRNNDLLVLIQLTDANQSIKDYFFDVTCDPKSTQPGIAHTCEQIYRGNVGVHRGNIDRPCIRSDYGFGTWYNRTDASGNVENINPGSDKFTSIAGHIGINIHNANGCYNSSLGCTMFDSEGAYQKIFRPIIVSCKNKANVMVALINEDDVNDILGITDAPVVDVPVVDVPVVDVSTDTPNEAVSTEIKPDENVNP